MPSWLGYKVTLFFSFIIAMFVTMILIPPLMRSAAHLKIVDVPNDRKVHSNTIPRIGGVAMLIGTILPISMWLLPYDQIDAFLLGMGIIFIFGLWDDRKNLDYRLKFLGQIIAVLIVVLYGNVVIKQVPLWSSGVAPDFISIPLTIFFLLGITNAINLSDGLDGLAGGTTMLSFGIIALLSYIVEDIPVLLISLAIIGSILGFLRFNTFPASIFMGDGGSQFLGFSVGVLSVMLTQNIHSAFSPALPLILLGLPIFDTLLVMGQRIYEKRSPFSPDKNHIHHKLLLLGFDHYEAVVIIYIIQATLVMSAFYLRYETDALVLGVYILFCVSMLAFFHFAVTSGRQLVKTLLGKKSPILRKISWIHHRRKMFFLILTSSITMTTVPVFLLIGIIAANNISPDLSILALLLFLIFAVFSIKHYNESFNWIERACVYVLCTMVIYITQTSPGEFERYSTIINIFFAGLVLLIVIGFRFSHGNIYEVTPLDFLVIFIAFTVPNMPGAQISEGFRDGIPKMIVLYYAVELMLSNVSRHWGNLRLTILVILALMGLRGIM